MTTERAAPEPTLTTRGEAYLPISRYGAIGDCRTAALVAPDGSIDWCCLPHFDSPATFCRILDADHGGSFQICPVEPAMATMAYLDGTNVLETTFAAPAGRLRLVDFMPIRHRQPAPGIVSAWLSNLGGLAPGGVRRHLERQAGNDVAAAHRITRIATALEGAVTARIRLDPRFNFGESLPVVRRVTTRPGAVAAILANGDRFLVFVARRNVSDSAIADGPLTIESDATEALTLTVPLRQGQRVVAMLNYARDGAEAERLAEQLLTQDVDRDLDETMDYWRHWSAQNRYDGPYQSAVLRSALMLKLCTFEPTGAIVAAPTTSLPEEIGGERNWDYRYTWLRDSVFTLEALGDLGFHHEARDYFHFLHDLRINNMSKLRIMYGIRGASGEALRERELSDLAGYRDSRPVRVGNGAATQRQLDIYGEVVDAAYRYLRYSGYRMGHRQRESQRALRGFITRVADEVVATWRTLDQGLWEQRGPARAFVYSRVMCWVALDRACRVAMPFNGRRTSRWRAERDAIRADVLAHGYSEELKSFTQSYGDDVLDAANLRLSMVGFLPASDPRIIATIAATQRVLSAPDGLLYRYRPAGGERGADDSTDGAGTSDDGLNGKEGAFAACTFWLIRNLCELGRIDEARHLFEQMLALASPLGLFAEEIDPATGAQLGNYPQAFTHIGLITAATALQRAQEGKRR